MIGGRAIHPVNCVVGGFGAVPSVDQLLSLRAELEDAVSGAETAVAIMASLPAVECGRVDTVFAAVDPGATYNYYHGEEIVVRGSGIVGRFAAADYRLLTSERSIAHSLAKHSAYQGRPFMVGALARLTLNGQLLDGISGKAREQLGLMLPSGDPLANNLAQAVELEADIRRSIAIIDQLLHEGVKPEPPMPVVPRAGTGTGATEAPRGILVHSYTYDAEGRIRHADIITPTAMNANMLETHMRAAVDVSDPADEPALKRRLEMVARAYDPCISCSVHVVRL